MSGFVPDAGKDFTSGVEAEIAARLDALAKHLGITIYGLSGARTPAHSVAVGGSANDPHTKGAAADIGVNSQTRASAAMLTDAQLASVGLYRPFAGATEINHVQLLPGLKLPSINLPKLNPVKGSDGGSILGTAGKVAGAGAVVLGGPAAGITALGANAFGIGGQVAQTASDVATAPARATVGFITDELAQEGTRLLVYIVLIIGGASLALYGIAHAFGLKRPPIPAVPVPA